MLFFFKTQSAFAQSDMGISPNLLILSVLYGYWVKVFGRDAEGSSGLLD